MPSTLTKVTSAVSTTGYTSFDILGRVTGHKQTTDGQQYTTGYTYNLAGGLVEETYPSGRVVRNVLDGNGDLSMVESKKNTNAGFWHYADSINYTAAGAVTSLQLGNGHWESTTFNSRLQPTQIALGVLPGQTGLLQLDYSYGTTANNGNILSQTITVKRTGQADLVLDQNYSYDSLNRIQQADEKPAGYTQTQCDQNPGHCWKQTYTFDRYGNRRFDQNNTTFPLFTNPNLTNPAFNPANNRMASGQNWGYDSAGNVTNDPEGRTFTFDGENKQVKVRDGGNATIGEYYFDGDGKRVKKIVPATGEITIFIYDAASKLVAEYSNIDPGQNESGSAPAVAYLTNDNLGTPRINTDASGAVAARHDYMPYGEEIMTFGTRSAADGYDIDTVRQKFTGYQRDDETDLDYAVARMHVKTLGRFSSPDPVIIFKLTLSPQLWNKYTYAQNNPPLMIDVSGEFPYTFYIRSFAPPGAFSGSGFHDDKRSFSTDTSSETTSRIQQRVTLDVTARSYGSYDVSSSPTVWNGVTEKTGNPVGQITASDFVNGPDGIAAGAIGTEYSGQNPITAGLCNPCTPAIDTQAIISIGEKEGSGLLVIGVSISGDRFPATEAFVADPSGNKLFLVGANAYGSVGGGAINGNPQLPVASAMLTVQVDNKGNFTGVIYDGKTYTVEEWNKRATATPAQVKPRDEQQCNCQN